MKEFGQTDGKYAYTMTDLTTQPTVSLEGNKLMTTKGTKEFAQSASSAYKTMTASQKEELRKKYAQQEKTLTVQNSGIVGTQCTRDVLGISQVSRDT